ncbi:MAG: hypothetical protein AB1806_13895 [Acidobacteriota bacterium]
MPRVAAWEDDPLSFEDVTPVTRPVPDPRRGALAVAIGGRRPEPRAYHPGTAEFRYWTAAEALARSAGYWAGLVPGGTRWWRGSTLPVTLDRGVDLNAYYDRQGLSFFHATIRGTTVYSGESPDVLAHELGHAILDAVRPQLWNAATLEVAAFHESFSDISAMLSGLQLLSVRRAVLEETSRRLSRASRLSRLAEQLGWAVRQIKPDAVDADCLRNAVNSFFYRPPEQLPPSAPASSLSSQPHSFSRVFTGAWLESLAGMLDAERASPATLLRTARDAGRLLVAAVRDARIASNYFAQVAAHTLRADEALFHGRYRAALSSAFVRRGILSPGSAAAVAGQLRRTGARSDARRRAGVRHATGTQTPASCTLSVDGESFGLSARRILMEAPVDSVSSVSMSAAFDHGSLPALAPERAARAFLEDLVRTRRLDPGPFAAAYNPRARLGRTTHVLIRRRGEVELVRRLFHVR